MPVTLNGRIILDARFDLANTLDLSSAIDAINQRFAFEFQNGTGANQANMVWHDTRTLAASGTEDLDLAGVLTNMFGVAVVFTKIKAVIVKARAENTNNVTVARAAANGAPLFMAAGDGVSLVPGGMFCVVAPNVAGIAVTAGTGDLLTVTNAAAGTPVTYDVIVVGTV
jgi:hypothetical protein